MIGHEQLAPDLRDFLVPGTVHVNLFLVHNQVHNAWHGQLVVRFDSKRFESPLIFQMIGRPAFNVNIDLQGIEFVST